MSLYDGIKNYDWWKLQSPKEWDQADEPDLTFQCSCCLENFLLENEPDEPFVCDTCKADINALPDIDRRSEIAYIYRNERVRKPPEFL